MTPDEHFQDLLARKRAERDGMAAKLGRFEHELRALEDAYSLLYGDGATKPTGGKRGDKAAKLRDALASAPAEGLTLKELQLKTGGLKAGSIKVNLVQWTKTGAVVRVSRGRYRSK